MRKLAMAMVALAVLAGAGIGYAHWQTAAKVDGGVITGNVDAYWVEWSCAGIGEQDDRTATPVGFPVPSTWTQEFAGAAFEVWKTGRDVAQTVIEPTAGQGTSVAFRIEGAYPSHYETCEWGVENVGNIPLAASYAVIRASNAQTTFASGIFAEDGVLWLDFGGDLPVAQINPTQTVGGPFRIHVEQTAGEDALYSFEVAICLHNWNEAATAADDVCNLYEPQEVADGTVHVLPSGP